MISGLDWIIIIAMILGYDLLKDRNKYHPPKRLIEAWTETVNSIEEAYEISDRNNKQGYHTEIIDIDPENDVFEVRMLA